MTYVVVLALLLLITLLGSYLLIENNRKKTLKENKRLFNERVASSQKRLKTKLNELHEAKAINIKHLQRIQAIANNYFVVQAHTEENLTNLEALCDQLIHILTEELSKTYRSNDSQAFNDSTKQFVDELPAQGILFNKSFYQQTLPTLLLKLKTEEINQAVDNNSINDDFSVTEATQSVSNESVQPENVKN